MKKDNKSINQSSYLNTDAELKEERVSTIASANEEENFSPDSLEASEHTLDDKTHNVPEEPKDESNIDEEKAKLAELRKAKSETYVGFSKAKSALKAAKKKGEDEKALSELEEKFNDADMAYRRACSDLVEFQMDVKFRHSRLKQKPELRDQNIILSVRHLKMFFKLGGWPDYVKLKAVHDISFDVREKETFGIVGESGCGKSTTGRCIMHLYDITSGSIYYKGYRIGAGDRWNKKEIKNGSVQSKLS